MASNPELRKVEESVKQKYLEIVKNLSLLEMKKFNKHDYQKLVQNDMIQLLPEFDKSQLKETALYVSNALNNSVKELLPKRSREASSRALKPSDALSESVLQELDTTMQPVDEGNGTSDDNLNVNSDTDVSNNTGCKDGSNNVLDDSITFVKQTLLSENIPTNNNKDPAVNSKCCDACNIKPKSKKSFSMIRCSFCMSWYHELCVGVKKDEPVGIWLCLSCRQVPQGLQSSITALTTDVQQLKVSTSSIISTLEKHVNKHLMAYMNKYNLIHESQSGFRQKHSCQTALIKLTDKWMADIDKGNTIGSMFIDFRKAFDLVDHEILIQKLAVYKLNNASLRWFISYLEARQQTIQYDRGLSSFSNIKSGVPQGSILGPTLFLLFVNDLPLFLKHCYCDLFADDTTVHTSSPDTNTINEEISADFLQIINWSKRNKLPINLDKTTYMLLNARKRVDATDHLELNIDAKSIKQVSKQKLLGIVIDENLSWTPQIDNLCSILASKISLLKHISAYVPQDVQKMFYQAYILPILDYGSNTWGTTSTANIERLSKLQKRAARIILKADFMTPSSYMFEQLGWQTIPKRLLYNKSVLVYKALNDLTPTYITNLLTPVSQAHSRSLRSSENGLLSIPRSRSALFDRSFSYSASKLWNVLPLNLRTASSLNEFKSCLRNYLIRH